MFYVRDEISRQMLSESTSKCDRILKYDSESHVNHGVTDHDRRDNTTSMTDWPTGSDDGGHCINKQALHRG